METVLVTGSSGGIGRVLVPLLSDSGFRVLGFDIQDPDPLTSELKNFEFIRGSVVNPKKYLNNLSQHLDYVVHLAAISSLPECEVDPSLAFETNLLGTVNIVKYLQNSKIQQFVNASTSAVYEGVSELPFTEELSCKPKLTYPQTKLMSERFLASQSATKGFPAISLRLFNVIGPFQDYSRTSPPLVNYLVREYVNSRRPVLHSDGYQSRDYISVYDVCSAIILALNLKSNSGEVFNVCSDMTLTVRDIDEAVRRYFNTDIKPIFRSSEKLWDAYPELFVGEFSLKQEVIMHETNKKSVGSAERFKQISGWNVEFPILNVIEQICSDAERFILGQKL